MNVYYFRAGTCTTVLSEMYAVKMMIASVCYGEKNVRM